MNSMTRKSSETRPAPCKRATGFTLIETITVMSIVAILMAIGVPSYRYITTANRMSSDINGLLGDFQYARAEAIKEGQTVSVCATTDFVSCTTAGVAWQTGWLVFTDSPALGTINGNDTVLRVQKAFSNQDTLQGDNTIRFVSFNREGFTTGLPGPITLTLHDAPAGWNAQYTRCLSLSIVGAMSTQTAGQTTAENVACT